MMSTSEMDKCIDPKTNWSTFGKRFDGSCRRIYDTGTIKSKIGADGIWYALCKEDLAPEWESTPNHQYYVVAGKGRDTQAVAVGGETLFDYEKALQEFNEIPVLGKIQL